MKKTVCLLLVLMILKSSRVYKGVVTYIIAKLLTILFG